MSKLFFVLFSVALFVSSSQAFQATDSSVLLVNFQEKDPLSERSFERTFSLFGQIDPDYEIVWNERHMVPSSVTGTFGKTGRTSVMNDYMQNLPEGVSLRKSAVKNGHETYEYSYNGTRIFPSVLTYSQSSRGFMLSGSFVADSRVKNQAVIDAEKAVETAVGYLRASELRMKTKAEAVYFDTLNGLVNAYLVSVASKEPMGDFQVVVDAENSEILFCDNLLAFSAGEGTLFVTNPLKCSVSKENIINIKVDGYLQGLWAKVENEDADEAFSDRHEFNYATDDTHFDEVNVYYHMNLIHDYFKNTFGYNGMDKQMKSIVHYGNNYDNAFFSPWGGYFAFGDGSKFNNLAREASVIYHEYTHGVSSAIAGLGTYGEAGAMNEGFSDYFGNTITNDPDIGEWVVNKMGKPYLRSCINNSHYPESVQNECHVDSLMWSAPLWQLREAFGKDVTDNLAHFCRFFINNRSSFADGLAAIIKTDEQRYNGVHKQQIVEIFAARGIMLNNSKFQSMLREKTLVQAKLGEISGT